LVLTCLIDKAGLRACGNWLEISHHFPTGQELPHTSRKPPSVESTSP
jgi:hypothetical protein